MSQIASPLANITHSVNLTYDANFTCAATSCAPLEHTIIAGDSSAVSVGGVPWSVGTHAGCSNSHGAELSSQLDFHHDWGRDKGDVSARYSPTLPQCGCWRVAEWHPGGPSCSHFLPRTAPVRITDGRGAEFDVLVDQSRFGAQWNTIGCYDMAAGVQDIVVSNTGTYDCPALDCNEGCNGAGNGYSCYWVADAFRLEWIAPSCDAVPDCASHVGPFQPNVRSEAATGRAPPEYLPSPERLLSASRVPPECLLSASRVPPEYLLSTLRVPPLCAAGAAAARGRVRTGRVAALLPGKCPLIASDGF